jgi:ER membrane protein complex subunit 7
MTFYLLKQVRVDISARNPGKIQAALTENRRTLNELVLEPMKEEQYYEVIMIYLFSILSL